VAGGVAGGAGKGETRLRPSRGHLRAEASTHPLLAPATGARPRHMCVQQYIGPNYNHPQSAAQERWPSVCLVSCCCCWVFARSRTIGAITARGTPRTPRA